MAAEWNGQEWVQAAYVLERVYGPDCGSEVEAVFSSEENARYYADRYFPMGYWEWQVTRYAMDTDHGEIVCLTRDGVWVKQVRSDGLDAD